MRELTQYPGVPGLFMAAIFSGSLRQVIFYLITGGRGEGEGERGKGRGWEGGG